MHVIALTATLACGGKTPDDKPPPPKSDGGAGTASPIAIPKSGIDRIERMNFQWGSPGSRDYNKAVVAYGNKPKRDWAAIKGYAEAALAKDAQNLGAHWLLAAALAQLGEHAAVVDHLVSAIAADYFKYGVAFASSDDLKPFMTSPHGAAVTEAAAKIRDDYKQRAAKGLFLIARRSYFRWPEKSSPHESYSRGDLYAFDRETRMLLRITHSDTVVGYVRAASGNELAVLSYDRIDRAGDDPPVVTRAQVQLFDADYKPGPKATIEGEAREIGLGYGPGDNLLVTTAPAAGRWGIGEVAVASFDRQTGKLTRNTVAPPVPRIVFSLEEGRLVRQPEGVKAAWTTTDPVTATSLEVNGKAIAIPESGSVMQSTVTVAPNHAAFATAVDPCAKDTAPSLHVVELGKGRQHHLLTGRSQFATVWLDATTLAYEDGEGQIRLWDATTARQLPNPLENKPGIALFVLSLAPGPLCKTGGQAGTGSGSGSGSGSDEPLPPED